MGTKADRAMSAAELLDQAGVAFDSMGNGVVTYTATAEEQREIERIFALPGNQHWSIEHTPGTDQYKIR